MSPTDDVDDLIFRFLRGEASEVEKAALRKHVEADPELTNRIFAAAETEHDLAKMAKLNKAKAVPVAREGQSHRVKPSLRLKNSATRKSSFLAISLAAAGIMIAVALYIFFNKSSQNQVAVNEGEPEKPVVARLEEITGDVAVLSESDAESPAAQGVQLRENQGLRTGKNGKVVVVFADGTRLNINADSRMKNVSSETAAHGKSLQMTMGSLKATVSKQPPGKPFVMRTLNAEAEVLGTVLTISASADLTRVAVLEGSVRLTRNDKATTVIPAGRSATASAGKELRATVLTPLDTDGTMTINFGPEGVPLPSKVMNDSGEEFSADRGYGWDGPKEGQPIPGGEFVDDLGVVKQMKKGRMAVRSNLNPDVLRDTFVAAGWFNSSETWRLPCENGKYAVTVCVGEFYSEQGPHHVRFEDQQIINAEMTAPKEWLERKDVPVEVKDGELTMTVGGHGLKKTAGDKSSDTLLCFIKITRIATAQK